MSDAALQACLVAQLGLPTGTAPTKEQAAKVTSLTCVGKGVTSLAGIEALPQLTSLVVSSNKISDLTPLENSKLTTLTMAGNQVSDLTALGKVTTLTSLNLDNNPVESIRALAPLTGLQQLSLNQRRRGLPGLTSLDGVQQMKELTRLAVNNSRISDLGPLSSLTKLDTLAALNNQIRDLTPLRGLTSLKALTLSTNQISDITPLRDLSNLSTLDLATNQISDLSALQGMPRQSFMGLKARWQKARLAPVPAELPTSAPAPRHSDGSLVSITPPAGVSVAADGTVTYAEPGEYVWTFDDGRSTFSGTITQVVTAASQNLSLIHI